MDQGKNQEPKFDLPQPASSEAGVLPVVDKTEKAYEKQAEFRGSQPQNSAAPQSPTSLLTGQQNPIAPPISPSSAQAAPQRAAPTPDIADDVDLIEKEWVERAKDIVESTKNDPHLQNQQISKFKADYIKKRYKKDIKLTDDA
ncbi:MAG: hypothetical protein WC657_04865 [Candidatus Paceibacterota bacterium]|jgi:hypothetical protein